MATSSSRPWRLVPLLAMVLALVLCAAVAPAHAASEPRPSAKSQEQAELICHTSDPKDCYPRIFQPTHEFQTVHDDQELPNGLHVRLNIWTGKKEAKINVPGETDPSLEGLPVEQAVMVVDPDESQDDSPPKVPKNAPQYDPVGKVKEPKFAAEGFAEGMKMLRNGVVSDGLALDEALEGLEDLSHDMYYGLKIAEDPEVIRSLFCLMTSEVPPSTDPRFTPRDQQAASILASTLQNNPPALTQVTKDWVKLTGSTCPGAGKTLGEAIYSSFVPSRNTDASDAKQSAARSKAKVSVVNGLIKDAAVRKDFLAKGGMGGLVEVLVPEEVEWAAAQRKVGQLALDNFLDEDMGAELGQWPRAARVADEQCREGATGGGGEGCWDHHVARIMKANKGNKNHWSRDLNDRLAAARKGASGAPRHHEEL
ncbi:nucleotide exchange factor sil1 [Purpureocillium takamizusanense]|uniref:Nucleotide exchange factor SIL1 n=1 Tax=Purpureocillium takamizusanense TaxID=2060973 RepID=A0A9Q8Q9W7_9HYPO|nr:nucleotide exchange factor sil1 [Purpureocillium takamizusanense]UNI15022.1 nucleotide exchange factor sil1 [Purpureocillium takamizusanense]